MVDLRTNKFLLLTLGLGTLTGLGSAIGSRFIAASSLALPEDAELISLDGAVITEDDTETPVAPTAPTSRTVKRSGKSLIAPIVRRNIFDSSKVGSVTTVSEDSEAGGKTTLPLILLATIVAEPAEFSSALIMEEKGDDGSQGYGIGDSLLGEAKIHRIEPRRVVLIRSDDTLEYLDMEGSTVAVSDTKGPKKGKKGKWGGIEKTGENKFVVDEDTFNKALENPEKLANSIRAVPNKGTDGIDGYRLSGIRRSSLFNKLGIRNGDVVHTVNGHELTSMQTAMEAYQSLQSERNFNFEVTRRNKRQTFEYEVR